MQNTEMALEECLELMTKAFRKLNACNHDERTRELSIAITDLETSMMWLNKDRANRGFLKNSTTHVKAENAI